MKGSISIRKFVITMVLIIATGVAFAGFGCGGDKGAEGTAEDEAAADTIAPGVSDVTPADRSTISNSASIVFKFNESMDTSSLVLGGTMASASDGGSWAMSTSENDTLTIKPQTTWPSGTSTLTVAVNDVAGNPLPTAAATAKETTSYNMTYGVQTMYVKQGGAGDGTMDSALGNIVGAIAAAKSRLSDNAWATSARVEVAKGVYDVSSGSTHIVMSEGISLYGSYSDTDWTARDLSANTTTIKDTSTSGGQQTSPNCAVEAESGITSATRIDGLTIEGGDGVYTAAIFNHDGASPIISNNAINGGGGSKLSIGIFNYKNSLPKIYNNTIDGGAGASAAIAIGNHESSSPKIYNNTIDGGGSGSESHGIYSSKGSNPAIDNNIIFTSSGTTRAGIYEVDNDCDATEVKNNDVFNCPTALYGDKQAGNFVAACQASGNFGNPDSSCAVITLSTPTGSGNVSIDPKFVDQAGDNWHLTSSSPTSVTQGGLDGSAAGWGFTTDRDGNPRTAPWSMGAYEYD
ncbi:MAG: Ig-like domain-containing protein [Pseudomonadota bacterium]